MKTNRVCFTWRGCRSKARGIILLVIGEERARVARAATEAEIAKYLGYLTKASVILLEEGLAFPRIGRRLQGIIDPRPFTLPKARRSPR